MDPAAKSNEQNASREFDFHFVTKKDTETKAEDGSTTVLKSDVVVSRLKVIAQGGQDNTRKERLVFDLQSGKLTVVSEPDSAQVVGATPDKQVIEGMVTSGWFGGRIGTLTDNPQSSF